MARYSIEDTTLTALGDAIRSKVGETEYRDISYTSITYHFDDRYFGSGKYIPIPVCGATQIKITKIATTDTTDRALYPEHCECVESNFPETSLDVFTLYNFTANTAGFYALGEPFTYDFEATWYDADGNQMDAIINEEVIKTMTPERMATEINNLGDLLDPSLLNFTNTLQYKFYGGAWDRFIELYGDKVTTSNIYMMHSAFMSSKVSSIPFDINGIPSHSCSLYNTFYGCNNLKEVPMIRNIKVEDLTSVFSGCHNIRYFPEGFAEDWDWTYHTTATSGYTGNKSGMFTSCYSLRKLPMELFKYGNPNVNYSYSQLRDFSDLYSLDEIVDMPYPHNTACSGTGYSGLFYNSFTGLRRCKEFTFAPDIGVKQWANQVLDLSKLGYGYSRTNFYNSGITADKEIKDSATKAALKDDPDSFAVSVEYSRYNYDSMINTINSLPDCSEYAAANGTNTIKFNIVAVNASSLPEDIAAVAAAKGWTVTLV